MPEKQSSRERLKAITDGIETEIQQLFQSEKYLQYLAVMSRFHKYSVNNTMLIYMQKPDASLVAGYSRWKNQFDRHVKRGERGITIIAPTPYKKKIEEEKLDPDTKLPLLDEDGNPIIEERTIQIPLYKPVKVFDVSQTEGKPLPTLAATLTGNVEQYEIFMEALRRSSPVPIAFQQISEDTDGFFSQTEQSITLREGMSEVQTVCAAIHEIAHSMLHNEKDREVQETDGDKAPRQKDRRTQEVEAESISYAVCQYYGIETGENSLGYIASWSKVKELKELKASLETINKTSSALISAIDRNYREICKERGITQKPERSEQEADIAEVEAWEDDHVTNIETTAVQSKAPADSFPDGPEQSLNEPMPDPEISVKAMQTFGYTDVEMLPLSKDRALELAGHNGTVYLLYSDNTEAMALNDREIIGHDGLFGITREDWETMKENIPPRDMEKRFREDVEGVLIYQLKDAAPAELRFASYDILQEPPDAENYRAIYYQPLYDGGSKREVLAQMYERFNIDRPADFTGHSMSVSDIVAIKRGTDVSYHYCDSFGFKELADFRPENYLKATEMAVEDDYGMIDGIINNGPKEPAVAEPEAQAKGGKPIPLMDLADAAQGERQRESVASKLQRPPKQTRKKPEQTKQARRKRAEREL